MADKLAVMASSPADYQRLGLSPTSIATWEDGARTDNSAGSYEWWYFDAHLADGAKLVVSFMNKDIAEPQKPLSPLIRLNLELPDGRRFEKLTHYPPDQWSSAKRHADVRLGQNRFTGDLHRYRIQATADEISIDATLTGEVPPWRPSTGYMVFGADRSREFAWLPSVPEGAVTLVYSVNGERHETTGVGYHDHNWGNIGLMKVVHDWYWARGHAGPYSVIASYITSTKRYGFESIPIFMLSRGHVIVGDDSNRVSFERENIYTDRTTGKPVATTTRYTYRAGDDRYVVSFIRRHDLVVSRMIDTIKGVKRVAARLAGFDGAYLRFVGDLQIDHYRGGELVEAHKNDAIWELMYFGRARD
ncbi:MAG TPA: hydroxyneurosporene dehydrogenase [Candidatus Dormibacteraeota bacterium]|nr:hydroxyneurosporene dehydrogenase [Candidatus Dormibacteraeota bacterium]